MAAKLTCKEVRINMMGLLDNEISEKKKEELLTHIEGCSSCKKVYQKFYFLKKETVKMKFKKLPDIYWDDYWTHVYNRMERSLGWIFVSIGMIVILSYGSYEIMRDFFLNPQKPLIIKIGAGTLAAGMVVLFVSVLREKIRIRKVDKYRSVER